MATAVDLSEENIKRRLARLTQSGRVQTKDYANGRVGYRVALTDQERRTADAELKALWKRVPDYLWGVEVHSRFSDEFRLLWTRELWESDWPGYIKSVAIEYAQWVNRTGDGPFSRVTDALIAKRTGYSIAKVSQARAHLTLLQRIHVMVHQGRGGGIDVRLCHPDFSALLAKYRLGATVEPETKVGSLASQPVVAVEARSNRPSSLINTDLLTESPVIEEEGQSALTGGSETTYKSKLPTFACETCHGDGMVYRVEADGWSGYVACSDCSASQARDDLLNGHTDGGYHGQAKAGDEV
jgi:hypothetical protein